MEFFMWATVQDKVKVRLKYKNSISEVMSRKIHTFTLAPHVVDILMFNAK